MGTKLDHGVIHIQASSVKSSVDVWGACLKTVQLLNKDTGRFPADADFENHVRQYSMDRMVDELGNNVSSIKKAMLQHDHVFKQQVRELHRLYSVQKMLMTSFKETNGTYNAQNLSTNHRCFDFDLDEKEADTELTLSIGDMKNSNKNVTKHSSKQQQQQQQQPEQSADVKLQEECSTNSATTDPQAMINKRPHWLLQNFSSHKT